MKKLFVLTLVFLAAGFYTVDAQVQTPAPSPLAELEQKVGLTDITIVYSRPGVKDREIFGGLVPYGQMWRTGANASTKITFSEDVKVKGMELPAGTYAIYTIPNPDQWTVIFHENLEYWGTGGDDYDPAEDALRVNIKPQRMGHTVETMTFDINDIRNNSASLNLMWANTLVSVPLEFNTGEQVQASIDEALAGPSGSDYFAAARFYYEEGKDLQQAKDWVDLAIEKEYNGFWVYKLKSEIQADMGKYKEAIETAKMSKEKAMEAGAQNYVEMNEENIKMWSGKM